jgi:hypothetical protein
MAVSTIDALYNGTSEKLTTSATGITVTGTVAATAYTGDGSALTGTGSPSIVDNGNATAMTITSDENVGIGVTPSSAYKMQVAVATNTPSTGSPAASSLAAISGGTATVGDGVSLQLTNTSGAKETAWRMSAVTTSGNNGDLVFNGYTGGATYPELMRILSGGGITFNGDTAAANALNDYEEGTWTPLAKGTSTNPSSAPTLIGRYTKIGNQVNIYIKFDAVSFAGASGGVYFDGLPFSASGATVHGIGSVMQYNVCTFNDSPCLYVSGSAVYIYYNVSGGTWDNAQHTGSSAVYMNACATYTTNS